eukprot:scaffold327_cov257-Pinguiococcus_pyrenoidosus.AAC.45
MCPALPIQLVGASSRATPHVELVPSQRRLLASGSQTRPLRYRGGLTFLDALPRAHVRTFCRRRSPPILQQRAAMSYCGSNGPVHRPLHSRSLEHSMSRHSLPGRLESRRSLPGRLEGESAEILAIHDSRDRRSIDMYNQRLAERLQELEESNLQCIVPERGASQVRRELIVRSALATTKAIDDVVQRIKVPCRGKMVSVPYQMQQRLCSYWFTPFFGEGTTFDALDIFIHENKKKERWRPAICTTFPRPMREPKLRLHWVGFTSDWDQTLDLSTVERSRCVPTSRPGGGGQHMTYLLSC